MLWFQSLSSQICIESFVKSRSNFSNYLNNVQERSLEFVRRRQRNLFGHIFNSLHFYISEFLYGINMTFQRGFSKDLPHIKMQ
jgi:transposase-like protein